MKKPIKKPRKKEKKEAKQHEHTPVREGTIIICKECKVGLGVSNTPT